MNKLLDRREKGTTSYPNEPRQVFIIWHQQMNSEEQKSSLKTAYGLPCPGGEDYCG